MKKLVPILVCFVLSFIVTFSLSSWKTTGVKAKYQIEHSIIKQEIVEYLKQPITVKKIYNNGNLIGILSDEKVIDALLNRVYRDKYKAEFPDTQMGLGEDIYIVDSLNYYHVENKDDAIVKYLEENDLFSVLTNVVEFSDHKGVYATIYVKNIDDFYNAEQKFLLNFVSPESLDLFKNNKTTKELTTYGRRELSVAVKENITVSKGLASPSKIKGSEEEVLEYLSYGDNMEREYYEVIEFDTIEGVGSKNHDLTAQQVVNINRDVLKSPTQLLEAGTKLNVTYFTSPINVVVEQELIQKEIVYPENTLYVEDETVREGVSWTYQEAVEGSKNVKYKETYINGVLMEALEISSVITSQPVQEIVYVGSKVIPGIGSGTFRIPVDNMYISCGYLCYPGHQAIDIQNRYNRYGDVYAADRGTVVQSGYKSVNGYYMVIDHGNGYQTYYGHFNKAPYFPVGVKVDKGEIIGQIGKTGLASGPHVHFEIRLNGERLRPCSVVDWC